MSCVAARLPRACFAAALAFALLAASSGCSSSGDRVRCGECGMYADVAPAFASGAVDREGHALRFDAPRCLFRWRLGDEGRGSRDAWVTEHYTQRRANIDDVSFVTGSDVTGPMGRDFIPVSKAEAARFVRDHGGREIAAAAIDARALRSLDP